MPLHARFILICSYRCGLETFRRLKIPKHQAVFPHVQRIVVPSSLSQGVQHVWPNCPVVLLVVFDHVFFYFADEAHSLHCAHSLKGSSLPTACGACCGLSTAHLATKGSSSRSWIWPLSWLHCRVAAIDH